MKRRTAFFLDRLELEISPPSKDEGHEIDGSMRPNTASTFEDSGQHTITYLSNFEPSSLFLDQHVHNISCYIIRCGIPLNKMMVGATNDFSTFRAASSLHGAATLANGERVSVWTVVPGEVSCD